MKKWAVLTVVLSAVLLGTWIVFPILVLKKSGSDVNHSGGLTLGAPQHLLDATVGADGGTIAVQDGALSGFSITVPENAYDGGTDFSVSMTEIKSGPVRGRLYGGFAAHHDR